MRQCINLSVCAHISFPRNSTLVYSWILWSTFLFYTQTLENSLNRSRVPESLCKKNMYKIHSKSLTTIRSWIPLNFYLITAQHLLVPKPHREKVIQNCTNRPQETIEIDSMYWDSKSVFSLSVEFKFFHLCVLQSFPLTPWVPTNRESTAKYIFIYTMVLWYFGRTFAYIYLYMHLFISIYIHMYKYIYICVCIYKRGNAGPCATRAKRSRVELLIRG